jgi:hypothetical protein
MNNRILSYNIGQFIRKEEHEKIQKPNDIGMILKPRWSKSKESKFDSLFKDGKK